MEAPRAVAIDLDGALGDTHGLWRDWLASAGPLLPAEAHDLPGDRAAAADALDGAGGNWRTLLERFASDRAPVYLRRDAAASAALRRLSAAGARIGVFTDAPRELAEVALAHLGAARRVSFLETGAGALDRLREELGADVAVVRDRAGLTAL
jgi:phosphoglycolate phosphatase-like HAD superfamily hydrolase